MCRAGRMLGLRDSRTGLCAELWRIYDELSAPLPGYRHEKRGVYARYFLALENVSNLLNERLDELWQFMSQAHGSCLFELRGIRRQRRGTCRSTGRAAAASMLAPRCWPQSLRELWGKPR